MGFRLKAITTASLGIAVVVVAAACSSSSSSAGPHASSSVTSIAPVKHGGSITVLESKGYAGDYASGLDPATDPSSIPNQDMMEAIYGQLFELGANGQAIPDLATGYTFSPDAKDVTITLRQGVKFSDGTPFNAQAVSYNWYRDMGPIAISNGIPMPWMVAKLPPPKGAPAPPPGAPPPATPAAPGAITVTGPYTIVVHQLVPNGAFID